MATNPRPTSKHQLADSATHPGRDENRLLRRLVESARIPEFIRDPRGRFLRVNDPGSAAGRPGGRWTGHAAADYRRALMESEERVRALAVTGSQCVWLYIPGHDVLELGDANWWEELTGQKRRDTRGMGWLGAIHPEDRGRVREAWEGALGLGEESTIEYRVRRRDGQWRTLSVRAVPIRGDAGAVREWIGTITDITEQKQAREERDAARENLQLITDVIPSAVARCGSDLRYIWANRNYAERICSSTPDRIIGRRIVDVVGEEVFEVMRPHILQVLAGIPVSYDAEARFKTAGKRWVHVDYTPTRVGGGAGAPDGEVDGWVAMVLDITERKLAEDALRRSEEELRSFFDTGTISVAQVDSQTGRILRVNDRFCRLIGYSREELLHTTFSALTHPEDRAADWERFQKMVKSDVDEYTTEKRYLRADGSVVWAHVGVKLVRDWTGRAVRTIGTVLDITHRKLVEEQLRTQTSQLKRSVADLEDFAHIAAHDLKEPLRGMRLTIGMLKEDAAGQLTEEHLARLDKLDALSGRMAELLDATLDYSRVGHEPMRPGRADLGILAAEVVEGLQPGLAQAGATVVVERPMPTLECDPALVRQAFANLVENAVKYNKSPDKRIRISADLTGPVPVIRVMDNGIGIAPQHHRDVFSMFKRLHGREGYTGGTGAGLAIVKRAVERHGGRIWVDSEPGRGSTFSFTLAPEPRADSD